MNEAPTSTPDPREAATAPYRGIAFGVSLKWLAAGALLYALLLLVTMAGNPGEATWPVVGPSLYLTPMFGVPYVITTLHRPGRTRRILFFLILLPLIHVAANYVAWSYAVAYFDLAVPGRDVPQNMIAGGLGGLTGAVLAFALLRLVRLTAPGRSSLVTMMFGTVLLTAAGAAGMAAGLQWTDALVRKDDPGRQIIWYEIVHFPWQLLFALLLATLMRKGREPPAVRREPEPAPEPAASDSHAVAERMRGSISAE